MNEACHDDVFVCTFTRALLLLEEFFDVGSFLQLLLQRIDESKNC